MSEKAIKYRVEEGVAIVQLNRADKRNALTKDIKADLMLILQDFRNNADIRAMVLTGTGNSFCAGGDLDSLSEPATVIQSRDRIKNAHRDLLMDMLNTEKPIIAAVNGFAFGAGFNLALACDIIYSADNAKFSQSFVNMGLIPDMGGLYFLPKLVGVHKAKELVFTAKVLSPQEAYELGIVNKVVAADKLMAEAIALAKQLAQAPTRAIGFMKTLINKSQECDLNTLLNIESFAMGTCLQSEDFKEGYAAFKEKRTPHFQGK